MAPFPIPGDPAAFHNGRIGPTLPLERPTSRDIP